MNVLFITNYFPPEIGAASHLFYDLAEGLTKMGHRVTVVTGFPKYNVDREKLPEKYKKGLYLREDMNGIRVLRLKTIPFPQYIPVARGLDHFTLAGIFLFGALLSGKQDVILIYSPPLTLGVTAYFVSKIKGIPFVANIQDLFPQNAVDLGILKNKYLIKMFEIMERFVYRKADCITVHSEKNKLHVAKRGGKRVIVMPNMVDTEFITPMEKYNSFREEHGLGDKFVISFAGTMGYSQDLDVVLECAKLLERYEDILFLLVGDGVEKKRLETKAKKMKLGNVKFLPMQPKHRYPYVLAASDVSLVTLKREVKTPVVPSKILSIMASGRPVVGCMNLDGDAPELIEEAQCGYCIEAENSEKLAEVILELYRDRKKLEEFGKNGREFAEKNLSKRVITEKYEKLFMELIDK
jgi:glycosyltransferase involved in cell wall biosynthesis